MLTAAEYNALPIPRKRDLALAVDALERLCAEALALTRRAASAVLLGDDGREAERCEIAAMMARNQVFSRQMDFALQGFALQVATDENGNPIRVRRPAGFLTLDAIAAKAAQSAAAPLPAAKPKRRAK
jgi:hypothetical protein